MMVLLPTKNIKLALTYCQREIPPLGVYNPFEEMARTWNNSYRDSWDIF
jgi:hypothetical protein